MRYPTLRGVRITLRVPSIQDAPSYVRWLGDKKVVRYLMVQGGATLAAEKKWIRAEIKNKEKLFFNIFNEDGILIGNTGLHLVKKDSRAGFGIMIGEKKYWGKGYASECLDVLLHYVFRTLKYRRVTLTVYADNAPARHVYTKAGFIIEGIRRQHSWNTVTKKFSDEVMMAIMRENWEKKQFKKK